MAKNRYIDADKLLSYLENHRGGYENLDRPTRRLLADIRLFTSLCTEPVIAKWEPHPSGSLICSNCHDWELWPDEDTVKFWKFCPNCGARMEIVDE